MKFVHYFESLMTTDYCNLFNFGWFNIFHKYTRVITSTIYKTHE